MSRTHSAGSRKSSMCQSATQIVFRIAVVAGKMRTSQTENSFHLGRRYMDGQQFSRQPQIDDAPVGLGKALPNVPAPPPVILPISPMTLVCPLCSAKPGTTAKPCLVSLFP